MILFVITAILTAIIMVILSDPLMKSTTTWQSGVKLLITGALCVLALYLFLGSPDTPSRAAAFETLDNPRAQIRLKQQEELVLLQALSGEPDNTGLLLRLGTIQIESGRADDAIPHLARANTLRPGNAEIQIALAAAYFSNGLKIAEENKPGAMDAARKEMETALTYAPKGHPIRADIQRAISATASGH